MKYRVLLTNGGFNDIEEYITGRNGIYYEKEGMQCFVHITLINYIQEI